MQSMKSGELSELFKHTSWNDLERFKLAKQKKYGNKMRDCKFLHYDVLHNFAQFAILSFL